jgi:hypothetical protein
MPRDRSTGSESSVTQSPKRICLDSSEQKKADMDTSNKFDLEFGSNTSPIRSDSLSDVMNMLRELKASQESLKNSIEGKLKSITDTIAGKIDSLRDDFFMELSNLDKKVLKIEERLETLENHVKEEEFPVERTVIIINLREEEDKNADVQCKELVERGLGLKDITPVACKRLISRDGKTGIIKLQLKTLQDKVMILKNKGELSKTVKWRRVYLKAAQTHEEHLMRLNLETVLQELPNGRADLYRFTGNGRLIRKTPGTLPHGPGPSQQQHGPWQHPQQHGPPRGLSQHQQQHGPPTRGHSQQQHQRPPPMGPQQHQQQHGPPPMGPQQHQQQHGPPPMGPQQHQQQHGSHQAGESFHPENTQIQNDGK